MRITANEYADYCASVGCERISWAEYQRRALALGYRVDTDSPCPFDSRWLSGPRAGDEWPETSYPATHIASGLCFAHVDAPRDTLPAFQALRRNTVCVSRGRVRSV